MFSIRIGLQQFKAFKFFFTLGGNPVRISWLASLEASVSRAYLVIVELPLWLIFQPLKARSNACHYRGWLVLVSTNPFAHLDSGATRTCKAFWFGLWNRWQKARSWEQRKGRVHVAPPSAASSLPHSTGAGVFTQAVNAILLPYFCVYHGNEDYKC